VGVEGVGKVGRRLVDHLVEAGAGVAVCDVDAGAVERVRARHPAVEATADRDSLLASAIDIFSPCALGGALSDDTLPLLNARIICGGANNQLAQPGIEKLLADRGIVYAPDYLVNSGGVIQVADELAGFSFERAQAKARQIFDTTKKILAMADEEGVLPVVAADRLAERRMAEVGRLRGIWLGD
jgi:valine dehydrogenase (NAD+)